MDKEELTEGQKRLFLQYGTIPAGHSKEEMVGLTGQEKILNDKRYAHKQPLTNRNIYNYCEICKRVIPKTFYPPGQRFRSNINNEGSRHGNRDGKYCFICHKSMCMRCQVGILCKNCIEFFPETIKNKFLTLKKSWNIIRISSFFIILFSFLAMGTYPPPIPNFGISKLVLIVLIYLSLLIHSFGFYYIHKYFEDTTENFLKDLKENPEYNKNILNEVYAVYFDSFAHPENIYNLKNRFLIGLIIKMLSITIFFIITGLFKLL